MDLLGRWTLHVPYFFRTLNALEPDTLIYLDSRSRRGLRKLNKFLSGSKGGEGSDSPLEEVGSLFYFVPFSPSCSSSDIPKPRVEGSSDGCLEGGSKVPIIF